MNHSLKHRILWMRNVFTRVSFIWIFFGLAITAIGCTNTGTYPLDIFPEMHYQQSFKEQEPPRLDVHPEAVPITGREVVFTFKDSRKIANPVAKTPESLEHSAAIFAINCAMCHGNRGEGNGTISSFLVKYGYSSPPNLTDSTTQNRADGEIYWLITNGVFVMPRFGKLLTAEDRWFLVHYLRELVQ